MTWRVLITEKGKECYVPLTHLRFASKDPAKLGERVLDWLIRNGYIEWKSLVGEALFRDLDSFKKANGGKEIKISIELVDKEKEVGK